MPLLFALLALLMAAAPADRPAIVVSAPDTPVRLDRATILTAAEGPPVILYSGTNLTDAELETFTVTAYIFDADGTLKARQTAPARRTLDAHGTKYSALVLDGATIAATDVVVIGVSQAQRANSDTWWRTDLQAAATAVARKKGQIVPHGAQNVPGAGRARSQLEDEVSCTTGY